MVHFALHASYLLGQEPALQEDQTAHLKLSLRADLVLLPVATSFVENAARAFAVGDSEALALTLAAEEIFAYLCRVAAPGRPVEMRCLGRGYYVELDFRFQAGDFNMRAFNLTAAVSFDDHAEMEETGLLIASRMVDRFQFFEEDRGLRLVLIKEKSYPAWSELQVPEPKPLESFSVRVPDPEELKTLVRWMNQRYATTMFPLSFTFPGKVVDMVASNEYHAIVAADKTGHVGGGLIWHWGAGRLVEFFGPYLFNQIPGSGVARALVDSCIGSVARTHTVGLINRCPTPELPTEYFEPLSDLTFRQKDGTLAHIRSYYRHLEEDPGLAVWAHPSMEAFLRAEYRRLVFAREIKPVSEEGESHSQFSVLSAELDREAGRATLHPVWWGNDFRETLNAYVDTLLKEDLPNIFFEMDLGKSWHCHFAPALVDSGFAPRLVLPYAGKGDLVVFQYEAGEDRS
jgi:hypothetical protein